ncbi:hypothetical protein [Actinoplanes sp. ATCC 53533]|jgi:hypothetical protein|nr:hypothetical protein [Actinoplanes sp. ATCC 53533]
MGSTATDPQVTGTEPDTDDQPTTDSKPAGEPGEQDTPEPEPTTAG